MGQAQFYHLSHGPSVVGLAEWDHGKVDLDGIVCPIDDGHQRGGKRLTDLSVVLRASKVKDIVWTWQSECLLTDRALDVFTVRGFTGFVVKPVKARYKRSGLKLPRLWELVVTGWAGVAPRESGIKLIELCDACGYMQYSGAEDPEKIISSQQWDGSDFFIVWPLPRFIFIRDRVAKAIRGEKVSGAVLMRPGELDLSGTLGPGRLSYWMPDARARALGEPLGIY